ncbi:MAG: hypothetical protein LBN12_02410 [Clostridiales Family XIII bacterium]|jgi:outer membrane lipopolysaccharide assembly protein LptE/RlpB|nr:hypothetical protein [Clostridiales Family XIII bacterium]
MSKYLRRFWISAAALALALFAFALAGCAGGGARGGEQASPNLESVHLSSYNEGTNETQYVVIELAFDKQIEADESLPKIRIANENVKNENVAMATNGAAQKITIRVDKIREGNITLKLGEGKNVQTIEALAPNGVALETIREEDGSVTAEVTHRFNIRGIAWVIFTDDGLPVPDSLLNGADERDGAIAVHGHEFLQDDEYDIAANIAQTLTSHFGDRYEFAADGKTVTARSLTNGGAKLGIGIYNAG